MDICTIPSYERTSSLAMQGVAKFQWHPPALIQIRQLPSSVIHKFKSFMSLVTEVLRSANLVLVFPDFPDFPRHVTATFTSTLTKRVLLGQSDGECRKHLNYALRDRVVYPWLSYSAVYLFGKPRKKNFLFILFAAFSTLQNKFTFRKYLLILKSTASAPNKSIECNKLTLKKKIERSKKRM